MLTFALYLFLLITTRKMDLFDGLHARVDDSMDWDDSELSGSTLVLVFGTLTCKVVLIFWVVLRLGLFLIFGAGSALPCITSQGGL